jgi:hypothetical protein
MGKLWIETMARIIIVVIVMHTFTSGMDPEAEGFVKANYFFAGASAFIILISWAVIPLNEFTNQTLKAKNSSIKYYEK